MINVLIISHSLIPSVLLCGHTQMLYLKNAGKVNYKFLMAGAINDEDMSWADVVVFVRSESDIEYYASCMLKGKRHLVYVLDDDLLNLPEYASSYKYYALPSIKKNIKGLLGNCDTFLTPSHVLYEKYGKDFKNRFLIDEPSLGVGGERKVNDKIKIGFAGSIDRTQDINTILEDALIRIIEKYGDKVSVEFMGAKPAIVDKYKLHHIPYQEGYKKYTETMGEANWDIGLAPMPVTDFHSCKYINKYVEYASYGIAGIYTDCVPYVYGIRDRDNGLLVSNNSDDWFNAISLLIEDEELRKSISRNCYREAETIYSLETLSNDFYDKMMTDYVENKEEIKGIWKYKVKSFFARVVFKIKEQNIMLPFWMINKLFRIITGTNNKNNTLVNLTDVTKGL
ncbi:MAG: hypothetical protein Q4D13_00590 [Erysipelotrichaceae bacterium]|nr:hypothetical protein [Erysipelotrichaceae bacterium]